MIYNDKYTQAKTFHFSNDKGAGEHHIMIEVTEPTLPYQEQVEAVFDAYNSIRDNNMKGAVAVFARCFMSDSSNQMVTLKSRAAKSLHCAVSYIQQPPLNGSKLALWVWLLDGVETVPAEGDLFAVRQGQYTRYFSASLHRNVGDSEVQTRHLLHSYSNQLGEAGCRLKNDCLRTWFFVNDIDNNYAGMVKGRNEVFDEEDLTENTHFIASTGIGGRQADHNVLVQMDAIAVSGLGGDHIHYLYALDHLNRTSDYGVRFERGTYADFDDRREVYISGTASIDRNGNVLYRGDIRRQTQRMIDNVEALLKEAGMSFDNIGEMAIYLRDTADYKIVSGIFAERFADKPYVILLAPVCRPGWLIEMECMGVK